MTLRSSLALGNNISKSAHTDKPVICQLVHTLNVGGAELLARQFAEAACDRYRFVFVCLDSAGTMAEELVANGYAVEVIGRKSGFDWGCAWRLMEVLTRHRANVMHAHQYAPAFYAGLARCLTRQRISILFTEHGRDFPDHRRWKRVWANRLLFGKRDRFVAVGEDVRRALVENEGLPANRVQVIHNGIDVARYAKSRFPRSAVRRDMHAADDDLVIIQVARLNAFKDHATALRGFAQVATEFPCARLVIVGEGEERPHIEALVGELKLEERVTLLGLRTDIPALLAAADVFLLSSVSEGIPLTLIEAMAAGLPCVSTRVGGTAEVVIDEKCGLLCRAADPSDLAAKLRRLLASAELRVQFGEAGRIRSRERFSDRQMHAAYGALYQELISSVASVRPAMAIELARPLPTEQGQRTGNAI